MKNHFPGLILYAPFGSVISSMASKYNIKVWHEAFADRNYADNLTLIPRSHPQAVKHDIHEILEHIELMINKQQVITLTGKIFDLKVDTICIHGDNPMAEDLVKAIHTRLQTFI